MKTLLRNSLWVVLVIGAYVAGTMQRPGRPAPAAGQDFESRSKSHRVPSQGSTGSNGGRRGAADAHGRGRPDTAAGMEEAVAAVLRESDLVAATRRFTQLLAELNPENAPAILKALRESGGGARTAEFLTLLAHAWGCLDGEAAVQAFSTLRGRGSEAAKAAALAAWASTDPAAAMAWLEARIKPSDSNTDRRANALWTRGLLTGLARLDMDEAMQYLTTLDLGEQRSHVGVLVGEKLREGVVEAGDWALQLPDDSMRTTALETVGMAFLRQDLDGAKQWAGSLADRQDAHELVADVADALATRNPAEAADWVAALPPGPSQNHAYEDLFENWTRTDPVAAGESVQEMNPGPARDIAIREFSRTVARDSPEDALKWAGAITDSTQRGNVQVELARRWQKSSPAEAAAWVASNLPAEVRDRILPATP